MRGDIFGLMGEILQNEYFQYFDRSKRDMTELKLIWPVLTGQSSKIILSPVLIEINYLSNNVSIEELSPESCPALYKQ